MADLSPAERRQLQQLASTLDGLQRQVAVLSRASQIAHSTVPVPDGQGAVQDMLVPVAVGRGVQAGFDAKAVDEALTAAKAELEQAQAQLDSKLTDLGVDLSAAVGRLDTAEGQITDAFGQITTLDGRVDGAVQAAADAASNASAAMTAASGAQETAEIAQDAIANGEVILARNLAPNPSFEDGPATSVPLTLPDTRLSELPVGVTWDGVSYSVDIDPELLHESNGKRTIYVDPVNGSDVASAGDSWGNAYATPNYAYLKNVGSFGEMLIDGGVYQRADTVVSIDPGVAVRARSGKRVVFIYGDRLAWTAQGMHYSGSVADPTGVLDAREYPDGDPLELALVGSVLEVEDTPGSYYYEAGTVHVRLHDDSVPGDDVYVLRRVNSSKYTSTAVGDGGSTYLEGIEHWGGTTANFTAPGDGWMFLAKDCAWKYATSTNGLSILGVAKTVLRRCEASWNQYDGFNYHENAGKSGVFVEADCVARNNGRVSGSQNGSTSHESYVGLRVGGTYSGNRGANVADVGNSTTWNVDCHASDSTEYGQDFYGANMWNHDCVADSLVPFLGADGGTVHISDCAHANAPGTGVSEYYQLGMLGYPNSYQAKDWSVTGACSLRVDDGLTEVLTAEVPSTFVITSRSDGERRHFGTSLTLDAGWYDCLLIAPGDYDGPYFDKDTPDADPIHYRVEADGTVSKVLRSAALDVADTAQQTADNLPKVLHGVDSDPAGTAPDGSIWFRHTGSLQGNVEAMWVRTGGAWVFTPVSSAAIANLDVGKLTAGGAAIASVVAQEIASATAAFQRADIKNLFVTAGATINEAVIDKLWADVVVAKAIITEKWISSEAIVDELIGKTITAVTINGGTINGVSMIAGEFTTEADFDPDTTTYGVYINSAKGMIVNGMLGYIIGGTSYDVPAQLQAQSAMTKFSIDAKQAHELAGDTSVADAATTSELYATGLTLKNYAADSNNSVIEQQDVFLYNDRLDMRSVGSGNSGIPHGGAWLEPGMLRIDGGDGGRPGDSNKTFVYSDSIRFESYLQDERRLDASVDDRLALEAGSGRIDLDAGNGAFVNGEPVVATDMIQTSTERIDLNAANGVYVNGERIDEDTGWVNCDAVSGFDFSGSPGRAQVRRRNGEIYFRRGWTKANSAAYSGSFERMGTVPVGFRPPVDMFVTAAAAQPDSPGLLQINANGEVWGARANGKTGWISWVGSWLPD
ncbi:hypothetical protein [Paramicrobacterium agarici]|uniref:hypothetical protein n=1 Tax=Paramicrobacterium agarici TaxID=630514 RepID=UPI00114F3C97|nr:hypothetical protein [Microbacterium agarici]TQO23777.1 prefoldin subunit 5 [Microbacterium agarici]